MKIRLYLLGYKGYKILSDIIRVYGSKVINVVIVEVDKKIQNDYSNEIKEICKSNSIKILSRNEDISFTNLISLAIGWRWLIDEARVKRLIVLHDSILPKYRGFNPLVSALINGEREIGVTALYASSNYDQGDIIFQSISHIKYPLRIKDAIEIISENYTEVVFKIIESLLNNEELPRKSQNESESSYSLWRNDEDYHIDWKWDSAKLKRFIDAVGYPYLGAYLIIDGEKFRVIEAEEFNDVVIENRDPGKIIFFDNYFPVVVCEQGLLKIIKMVKEIDGTEYQLNKLRVRFQ